jgi:DNA-binding response OmpR family regulator
LPIKNSQLCTGISAFYIYHSNQYFPKETVLCGKVYFIANRRAADCMDQLNEKTTILLVDDDETVLGVGSLMIQKFGFKVLQATSGMEAIQIVEDNVSDICLVILDEKLPDKFGTDICKKLKEFEPDIKVLHTSGLGKSLADGGLECGCEAFLRKPFRIAELSDKLKEMLETVPE